MNLFQTSRKNERPKRLNRTLSQQLKSPWTPPNTANLHTSLKLSPLNRWPKLCIRRCRLKMTFQILRQEAASQKTEWIWSLRSKVVSFKAVTRNILLWTSVKPSNKKWRRRSKLKSMKKITKKRWKNKGRKWRSNVRTIGYEQSTKETRSQVIKPAISVDQPSQLHRVSQITPNTIIITSTVLWARMLAPASHSIKLIPPAPWEKYRTHLLSPNPKNYNTRCPSPRKLFKVLCNHQVSLNANLKARSTRPRSVNFPVWSGHFWKNRKCLRAN